MVTMRFDLGIISGDQKCALERHIGSDCFKQRKNYDEYYVLPDFIEFESGFFIDDLMVLAEDFSVSVSSDFIYLS